MLPLQQHPRYQLHDQLGHGGFSSVYRAWDKQYGLWVAVKVFIQQDEEGVRLCHQEYRRTNLLEHPNIIHFIDFGVDEGSPFIVMPYYAKGSMQNQVGEVTEEELWRLASDISNALKYMHALQPPVLHNDLKPDNFLVADDGSYILADFGISFELNERLLRSRDLLHGDQEEELDTAGKGPMAYQAPELFHYRDQKKQQPAMASEIWAFGACLYEMAVGDPPFGERGGMHQLMETKDHQRQMHELCDPLPSSFSGAMNNLIFDCLNVSPWNRPRAKAIHEEAQTQLGYTSSANAHPGTAWQQTDFAPPAAAEPTVGQPYQEPYREPQPYRPAEPAWATPQRERNIIWPVLMWIAIIAGALGIGYFAAGGLNNDRKEIKPPDQGYIQPPQEEQQHPNSTGTAPQKPEQKAPDEPVVYTDERQPVQRPTTTTKVEDEQQPTDTYGRRHSSHRQYHFVFGTFDNENKAQQEVRELTSDFGSDYPVSVKQIEKFEYLVYFGNFSTLDALLEFQKAHEAFQGVNYRDGSTYKK